MNLINFIVACCLVTLIQSKEWYEENNPHFLTDTSFPELLKTDNATIKIVKFFAPFCGYCRFLKKFFEEYKQQHEIHQNLKFYDVNCQHFPATCRNHKVTAYPAVIVFDTTAKQIRRIPGMYPKPMIYKFLDEMNTLAQNLPSQQPKKQPVISKQKEASISSEQKPKEDKQVPKEQKQQDKQQQASEQKQPEQTEKQSEQSKDSASKKNNDLDAETSEKQYKEGKTQNQASQGINKRFSVAKVVKYLLYLITGIIGGYYAFNVFRHKYSDPETVEETAKFLDSVEIQPQGEKKEEPPLQLQEQIKIDQIADENL